MTDPLTLFHVLTDRPFAFHPDLARAAGGVEAGVFLSLIASWSGKGNAADGFIYKTQGEIEAESGLTRRNQETARRKLRDAGVLVEDLRGVPARLHYKIDWQALAGVLAAHYARQYGDMRQTSLAESAILVWRNPPNYSNSDNNSDNNSDLERARDDDVQERWSRIVDLVDLWCKLARSRLPKSDKLTADYFVKPASDLLAAFNDDVPAALAALERKRDEMLRARLTPKRLSAVVPRILDDLEMATVAPKNGHATNQVGAALAALAAYKKGETK